MRIPKPKSTIRIRLKRYALIDQFGNLWDGILKENSGEIYEAYGSRSAALRDGWKAKSITIYFDL